MRADELVIGRLYKIDLEDCCVIAKVKLGRFLSWDGKTEFSQVPEEDQVGGGYDLTLHFENAVVNNHGYTHFEEYV